MRHLAAGSGQITHLDDLRAPMTDVLSSLAEQLMELQRYKAKFGELQDRNRIEDLSGSDLE